MENRSRWFESSKLPSGRKSSLLGKGDLSLIQPFTSRRRVSRIIHRAAKVAHIGDDGEGGEENPNAKKREAIVHLEASLGLITCRYFSLSLFNDNTGRGPYPAEGKQKTNDAKKKRKTSEQ